MKIRIPHTYVLLVCIIIICALLTYVIPAGEFTRITDPETGRRIVDPHSFNYIDQSPAKPFDIFMAVQKGLIASSDIIFFVFIIGGVFGIIQSTGFLDAFLGVLIKKFHGKELYLFAILMVLFSLTGAFLGFGVELLAFVAIIVALSRKLGYNEIVGLCIVILGGRAGFASGMMNPFTIGVAQGIAELPIYSGLAYRTIWYVLILAITIIYTLRYAVKVKDKPEYIFSNSDEENDLQQYCSDKYTSKDTRVLISFLVGFGFIIYGILRLEWAIEEMAAAFLAIGIVCGFAGNLGANEIATRFVKGAQSLTFGALIIGVARGIQIILQEGMIIDTIIYHTSSVIGMLPHIAAANSMYLFHLVINFFIPSGSGQAAATMPLMTPIADLIGITRQTAVLTFVYGDGFSNLIIPTAGTLMASLAIAKVPYEKWVRWILPLLAVWIIIGIISVTIAVIIGYGPF